MVKHALKNRRRGLKVTRKPPKHVDVRVYNALKDGKLKQIWDKSKSPVDNLNAAGFVSNANKLNSTNDVVSKKKDAGFLGYINLSDLQMGECLDTNRKRKAISDDDKTYAVQQIEKHGENYTKMARDIITNYKQLTEKQLEKLCLKFNKSKSCL